MAYIGDNAEPKDIEMRREQMLFWRTHLDVFIVDVLGIKLKDTQRVIARALGNISARLRVRQSGSFGV